MSKKRKVVQNQIEEEEVVVEEKFMGLREVCKMLDRSNVWIRRLVKEGRFEGSVKDVDGEWRIKESEVLKYLEVLKERERKYEEKKRGEFKYPYTRPSITSIRMIRTKVTNEKDMSEEERERFLMFLSKWEEEYNSEYIETRGGS